jgi:hypothetical protein
MVLILRRWETKEHEEKEFPLRYGAEFCQRVRAGEINGECRCLSVKIRILWGPK